MISIRKLADLEQFGVRPLTGEACRVGNRILCDLTYDAEKIVADLMGIRWMPCAKEATFPRSWNGDGATSSFMLPYSLFPDLAMWCLFHRECPEVLIVERVHSPIVEIVGREPEDSREGFQQLHDLYVKIGKNVRAFSINTNQPGDGTRCTHTVSNRAF